MRSLSMSLLVTLFVTLSAAAQSFNFTSINTTQPLTLNNAATVVGTAAQLTPNLLSQVGSLFHQSQFQVLNGFDTTFTFKMTAAGGADGMAFVIHNDVRGDTFSSVNGSALGYGYGVASPAGTGITNGLVIELDAFSSSFNGFSDTGSNEISIHTNGTGECSYGEDESLGRVVPTVDLNDGLSHTLRVLYVPGSLSVFLDGAATPTLSVPYDFSTGGTHFLTGNAVGGLSLAAGSAWIGFTAATGGISQTHEVEAWSFLSTAIVATDAALTQFTAPTNNTIDCLARGSSEAVTVNIINTGMMPIGVGEVLQLDLELNGVNIASEFFNVVTAIASGTTQSFTFATTADLSPIMNHTLTARVTWSADLDGSNDQATTDIASGGQVRVTNYPFVEDFAVLGMSSSLTPPVGFLNETTDSTGANSDWLFRNNGTPTAGTGPTSDNTTGISGSGGYAYLEDDSTHTVINLRSPCFDLSAVVNPSFRFFLHSFNSNGSTIGNNLSVDVISYPAGTVTTNVYGPQGPTSNSWNLQAVDLSPFLGQVIQIVLRGETSSSGISHDIAIDDFSVADLLPTPGQAPQPGLAVLNINDPSNINGDRLQFGFNGPYFSSVTTSGTISFEMEGEALQSIVLFAGPLNPGAATFANIGSIDVGGPIDPLTGLPTGLFVVGNGQDLGGVNAFFVTAANGIAQLGFTVPNLPIGLLGTFQCAIQATTGAGIALSNAVQVSIQ